MNLSHFSLIAADKAKTVDKVRLLKSYKAEDSYIVSSLPTRSTTPMPHLHWSRD